MKGLNIMTAKGIILWTLSTVVLVFVGMFIINRLPGGVAGYMYPRKVA